MRTPLGIPQHAGQTMTGLAVILAFTSALLLAASPAWAADEDPALVLIAPEGANAAGDGHEGGPPVPHTPAKPSAYLIKWDKYRTLVVVDTSAGLLRPAWIVTFATAPEEIETRKGKVTIAKDQVVVAYRGQAFHGRDGILHIDCHRALIMGALDDGGWSPDSFDIGSDLTVSTHDDDPSHAGNNGEVEKVLLPSQQGEEYRRLLLMAQSIIEGNS
jgi:hypothetical protein